MIMGYPMQLLNIYPNSSHGTYFAKLKQFGNIDPIALHNKDAVCPHTETI